MRDLYRKAHELGSQEVKDEVERLLLDKGYDMRHMFSEWEKPQMNRVERCALTRFSGGYVKTGKEKGCQPQIVGYCYIMKER